MSKYKKMRDPLRDPNVDPAVLKELKSIVGDKKVTVSKHILYAYSYDLTFVEGKMPDYAVLPQNTEQVSQIMKLANKFKIPVIPYTAGSNIGGLCIPEQGGIIMDLKQMNKIIELNDNLHYVVIEPGVSHAKLAAALYKYNLRFSWPVGPPSGSTSSCSLCHGIGGMSGRYGLNSEAITSMEVVLPTGEIVKIGSCAINDKAWHSVLPLPQMDGLFKGWLGTTGVVTKLGLAVHPIPPILKVFTASAATCEDMAYYMRALSNYEIADDVTAVSWWLTQVPIPSPYKPKPDGTPEWFSFAATTSWTEKEKDAREEIWQSVMDEEKKKGSSVVYVEYPDEALRARTQLPSRIVGSTKNYTKQGGGGIAWPGTFTPLDKWGVIYEEWKKIMIRRNFSPAVRITDYRGVHYGMLRAFFTFDKGDIDHTENARQGIVECLRWCLDNGGIPYKPGVDFAKEINKRCDQGYLSLLKRVKKMLDPNNIMNPGKMALEDED